MGPTGNEMVSDNQESATEATAGNQEESHKKARGHCLFWGGFFHANSKT